MKKRILSMLLAIVMVVGLLPGMGLTAFAADDDTPTATAIYVKETTTSNTEDGSKENPYTTLQAAFDATTSGGNYEIILLSDITVSDAVDQWNRTYARYEHLRYSAAANVTLKSDNDAGKIYTIYRDCDGLMIWLYGKNASDLLTLTLQDIVIDGKAGVYTSENDVYALIGITNTSLYIKEGTTLKNNVNTALTASATTPQGCGGAIYMAANSSLTMTGGSIQYCKAIYGGGVYAPNGSISIEGGTFEYNEATGDSSGTDEANAKGGGAIYKAGGTLKISGGTFQYNKAYRGGAIFGTGNITISGGVIKNNISIKHGGGIFSSGVMTISAGTISENCAGGRGGGIFRISSGRQLNLLGGTVSGNTDNTVLNSDSTKDASAIFDALEIKSFDFTNISGTSSGVVDYRTATQSGDTTSNTSSGGYIDNYVFTMVYMSNSFSCADTIYTNRPLRITAWDDTLNNSYTIEPLVTSSALSVSASYGGALPLGNFVVFGETEDIQPDLSKFSSTGYTLIKKDTLDRFIFYGVPLTAPQITLAAENGKLQYSITSSQTSAISGYEIQLYEADGTTKVGEPVSVTARTGTLTADAGTYKASVRAIDKKKNESGYIVKDITRYCESAWSSLSAAAVVKDTYTITYDLNNGSGNVPAAQTQDVGAGFSSAAQGDIARTGYTFLGWAKGASAATAEYAAGATVSDINTNTTLYAVWKVNSYTITFEENGGSAVQDITGDYNSNVTKPEDPTKTGYSFGGWYEDSDFQTGYTFSTMPVDDITLYAKWNPAEGTAYTVNHHFQNVENDEYTIESETKYGTTEDQTAAEAKTVTGFTAGDVTQTQIDANGTTVVDIYYSRNSHTLTFKPDNGGADVVASVKYGADITVPAVPEKTGYTFKGWGDVAATMPDSDLTYTATWNVNQYTIAFEENGGSAVADITANYNSAVTKPADPVKSGYTFGGWYSDSTLTQAYTFTTMPVGGITLYAKWTENPTPDPDLDPEPAPDPTPTPDPEDAVCRKDSSCPIYPYKDADPKEWYHDGVHYCLEEGIMIGYPDGTFQPYTETTRAQVVMMLWRLQGSPKVSYNISYTDVDGNGWYTEAIRWGTYAGVVEGNGDGTFTPDDSITREQMAAMFCRYAKVMGKDVSASASLSFSDADQVSDWAVDEVKWAVGSGLMEGIGNNTLAPTASANRAQVATVMYRFCEGS